MNIKTVEIGGVTYRIDFDRKVSRSFSFEKPYAGNSIVARCKCCCVTVITTDQRLTNGSTWHYCNTEDFGKEYDL